MLDNMRRLHPRGAANRGVCVDAEGAMLGPASVLVRRTAQGFRGIAREDASTLQKRALRTTEDEDWLFRQCRRIAEALDKGEIALAQIYGLRIPVDEFDDQQLRRMTFAGLTKWSFNPDEPRIPAGQSAGGEWTTGADGGAEASLTSSPATSTDSDSARSGSDGLSPSVQFDAVVSDDSATATDVGDGGEASSGGSSIRYEWVPSQGGNSDGGSPGTLPSPDVDQRSLPIAAFAGEADWLLGDFGVRDGGGARTVYDRTDRCKHRFRHPFYPDQSQPDQRRADR